MWGQEVQQPAGDYPTEPGFGTENGEEAHDGRSADNFEDPGRFALYMRQRFERDRSAPHDYRGEIPKPADEPADDMDFPEELFDLEDPTLFRCVNFAAVLWRGGTMLSTSEPPLRSFQKSKPIDVLDAFLSHNWDTPRWSKFLCLSAHRNHGPAFFATFLLAVFIVLLDMADQLPYGQRVRGGELVEIGPWNTLLCTPFFWALVLSDARQWLQCTRLGCSDARIFLDAACIDQENAERRKKCIQAIPAFVVRSRAMIAVLTPLYLQKVWTVFELMTFIALRHTGKNLHVEPALLAWAGLVGSTIWFVGCVIFSSLLYHPDAYTMSTTRRALILGLPLLPAAMFLLLALRAWGRELKGLKDRAQDFDFDTALCKIEADRDLLKSAAAMLPDPIFQKPQLLGHSIDGELGVASTSTIATSSTNNTAAIVTQIELVINNAVGRSGVPFRYLLGFILPAMSVLLDGMSADLRSMAQGSAPIECLPQVVLRTCFNIVLCLVVLNITCYLSVQRAPLVSLRSGTWMHRIEALTCWIVPVVALACFVFWTQRSATFLSASEPASIESVLGVGLGCAVSLAVCCFMSSSPKWLDASLDKVKGHMVHEHSQRE